MRCVVVDAASCADDDTLVGGGEYYKDVEISDSESSLESGDADGDGECGLGRKRTLRVVIRSRAFL